MQLITLGACGTYPGTGGACSGYLVRHDGFTLWVDAGNGTLGRLQEHVPIDEVDAIWLSHEHADHCVDLYPFFYRLLIRERRVPVFAPPGARTRLEALVGADTRADFARLLAWTELDDGDAATAGPFALHAFAGRHSVRANILRLTCEDRVLVYSGDTGPCDALVVAAADADLFLCEASWLKVELPGGIHMTAEQTGAAARAARARRLMLTHIWPHLDHEAVRAAAAAAYGGPVELAIHEGRTTI